MGFSSESLVVAIQDSVSRRTLKLHQPRMAVMPEMVAHTCNPSTWEAEAEVSREWML
jgi:ribosomal protein S19